MLKNIYRVTLFNTHWKEEMITYDCPTLPNQNDFIRLSERSNLFIVKNRGFSLYNSEGLESVVLYGLMEEDEHDLNTRLHWDRFLNRLKNDHANRELYNLNNFLDDNEDEIPDFTV